MQYNSPDFYLSSYKHHLELFHERKENYNQATSYSREQVVYYGRKCIELKVLSSEEYEMNMLPRVDFPSLFGTKGSIAGDGEE